MNKTTKVLLALSVVALIVGVAFNAGFLNASNVDALYIFLPLGAVFFGLFLIAKVLEREAQAYDAEHKSHAGIDAKR